MSDQPLSGEGCGEGVVGQLKHSCSLDVSFEVVRDSNDGDRSAQVGETGEESGLGAAASGAVNDVIEGDASVLALVDDLCSAHHVTETPERVLRRATRDEVGRVALLAEPLDKVDQRALILDGANGFVDVKISSHQTAQQYVATLAIHGSRILGPGKMQQGTLQVVSSRGRRSLPGVI